MSDISNNQGRAYEYACITVLCGEIRKIRSAEIVMNSSFFAAKHAWEHIDEVLRNNLIKSAEAVASVIFDLEPMIIEKDEYNVMLHLQLDKQGENGDVRDIVITRNNVSWEIGLSIKHNHFAVKHSRLAKKLDFGQKWFGQPCSEDYWNSVYNIFEFLESEKLKKTEWKNLPEKEDGIYVPLLQAFMDEILKSSEVDKKLPQKMVEYLLGEYDFYKVISVDVKRLTQLQSFNMKGTLNKESKVHKPVTIIPKVSLPTRIVSFSFKPKSKNTLELYMDGGWQFSFRIHNASTIVEPSLKFDIQIIGMPTTIMTINCMWSKQDE